MSINARIIADSITEQGSRLTTMVAKFPRFILAELNTVRMFSRNSASSRAIPSSKMMERIKNDPAMPVSWGANQKGMQAGQEVDEQTAKDAKLIWLAGKRFSC